MTGRERFFNALENRPPIDRIPTFELVHYLSMELLGKVHPCHRNFSQWNQMSREERRLQVRDMAQVFIDTARHYGHDAIFVHPNPWTEGGIVEVLSEIRELSGEEYFLCIHGDATMAIPDGDNMVEVAAMMYEEPEKLIAMQRENLKNAEGLARALAAHRGLLDGFALCSDYAFNANPFFSPDQFGELVAPVLRDEIAMYRALGFYTIKHSDGNLNPILDQIVDCKPHALHSIDPQGHMSLLDVRRKYGDRVATIGNVNCGLLQTGTEQQIEDDVLRCLSEGMADGGKGFVFSTSNCVYTGMALSRYQRMMDLFAERRKVPH